MTMKPFSFSRIGVLVLLLAGLGMIVSCSRSSFLDKKPNTTLVVPSTLADFQALLDNTAVIGQVPVLGEISADNFYAGNNSWTTLDVAEKNAYIWASDIFGGQGQDQDWDVPYQQVFYANVVLEGLPGVRVDSSNVTQWNAIKGAALFTRAFAFYNLAQLFAPVYDSATAGTDLGIPLRLSADINAVSVRSSVQQTYDQILYDLHLAETLLPSAVPFYNRNRPSLPAAQALLARVYLSIRDYANAKLSADSCLQTYPGSLMDYNTLDATVSYPISKLNTETLYQANFLMYTQILAGNFYQQCVIDSVLYQSYASNDLRRVIFYRTTSTGSPYLKGSYNGTAYLFGGLAIDEVYLIRAEGRARMGDYNGAMADLNSLLSTRWRMGTFPGFSASTAAEALDTVLLERRKELAFRGLRWTDLRRLNKEGYNITIARNPDGQIHTLKPVDLPLYTLPIPPDVIAFTGMPQNPR
jgi:hypothetical protein